MRFVYVFTSALVLFACSAPDHGAGADAPPADASTDAGSGGSNSGSGVLALTGQLWYVRLDGGTSAGCTGRADAPYPGTGSAQPCAFSNPYYLWGDDVYGETPTWKIAGGDSVVFEGGPFRMGYKGSNDDDYWGQCPGDPFGCVMPAIPAGSAGQTTKLVGQSYADCTPQTQTQLFGGYGLGSVIDLSGTQYVDVACLELTDHSQCSRVGNAGSGGCSTSYPLDDYAGTGITTNDQTANIGLYDLNIHGFTSRGIIGPIGGPIVADRVRIAYNAGAGWDFDDGAGTPSPTGAVVMAHELAIEWNGCNEEYPITDAVPAYSCFDQDSAGYGDGIGTPDTTLDFTCDHCTFDHNTQDGFDLLHASGSRIAITHSLSYANMGQQWKMGAQASVVFQDNVTLHDCNRMSAAIDGAPATYNQYLSLFCRAAGDGIAIAAAPTSEYVFQNNTFVGYGSTSYDIECAGSDCTGMQFTYQNNLNMGYPNPLNGSAPPGLFYYGPGISDAMWTARDHNSYFDFSAGCPTGFANETCGDPLFANEPTWSDEASLDGFDVHLTAASPDRDAGVTISGITDDYFGTARPQGSAFDIGAAEL